MKRYVEHFGRYWPDPWPYPTHMGVGLRLSGYPTDEYKFIQELQFVSCNPIACRVILNTLREKGVKYTTVMFAIRVSEVGMKLEELGVTVQIVPPIPVENRSFLYSAALDIALGKEVQDQYGINTEVIREATALAAEAGYISADSLGPYSHAAKHL